MNSHINDFVDINTWDDEEDSRTSSSSSQDSAKTKDDSFLILLFKNKFITLNTSNTTGDLDNFDDKTEREGESDNNKNN